MSPLGNFFANLKRLLGPHTPPPAESTEQPTAALPPLPGPVVFETRPPPATVSAVDEVTDDASSEPYESEATDDASEVRALLDAVAEGSVSAEPEAPLPVPASEAEPSSPHEPTPAATSDELPAADASGPQAEGVGSALVLTLATPAATYTIARSAATLGRGQENTVRLDDFSVSRRHARIAYRGGGYWLSDLGSMGGTWVDGVKLNAPRRVASGQVIDIGVCRLTVSFAADPVRIETRKTAGVPRSEVAEQARRRR
jgi:pSer/pThr/pTyr-binding forkhead associated (FHA) protein